MIDKLVLEKDDFLAGMVEEKIFKYLSLLELMVAPTFVLDIHNVIEYNNDQIDGDVLAFIKSYKDNYNFILLSFDTKDERIDRNYNLLNEHGLENVPKIFTKKRKKGHVIRYISNYFIRYIGFERSVYYPYQFIFVDDNINNIKDAHKIRKKIKDLFLFYYTKHSEWRDTQTIFKVNDEFNYIYNHIKDYKL